MTGNFQLDHRNRRFVLLLVRVLDSRLRLTTDYEHQHRFVEQEHGNKAYRDSIHVALAPGASRN